MFHTLLISFIDTSTINLAVKILYNVISSDFVVFLTELSDLKHQNILTN